MGPVPEANRPSARALWVAGLINPLPGLKLSPQLELQLEARPAVLAARTSGARVEAARRGIDRSIECLRRGLAEHERTKS